MKKTTSKQKFRILAGRVGFLTLPTASCCGYGDHDTYVGVRCVFQHLPILLAEKRGLVPQEKPIHGLAADPRAVKE
jgi:hypothetical protein